jgi:nucleoid DNA-binding protein
MKIKKNDPTHAGVPEIARMTGISPTEIRRIFSAIVLLIRKHGGVKIRSFGRFRARHFKARTLHLNGRDVRVPEKILLHFNSSSVVTEALTAPGGKEGVTT